MKREKKLEIIGKIALLLTAVVWGSSFIVLKNALADFGNGHFTFFVLALRFGIASLILFFSIIKKLRYIDKGVVLHGVILGAILFGAYGIQTVGLKYTTASKNAFLTVIYCVLVPFLSWLILKKKPKLSHYVAGALCITGIAFVAVLGKNEAHGSNEWIGDLLSAVSGLFYALQIIFISKYAESDDAMILLFFEIATVAVLCFLTTFTFEFSKHHAEISFNFEIVWKILYLAVFATCFSQFTQMIAQKYVAPFSVALLLSLEGVFSVVFELISGASAPSVFIWIGFVFIFLSQIVSEIDPVELIKQRREKNKIENNS